MDMLQFCFETFLLHVFYFLPFMFVCIFFLFPPHPLHFSNGPSFSEAGWRIYIYEQISQLVLYEFDARVILAGSLTINNLIIYNALFTYNDQKCCITI
jgi:TRAP-type mannitol/chloroaromatic compound transport system permease small subunit